MISLYNSTNEIQRFKKRIEDKVNHAFLGRYIQKPPIDDDKLFTLSKVIPENGSLTNTQRDTYIITTMLVQVALDTHELVPAENTPNESNEHLLTKQLRVLAGDYYSGLYYYLLSQIEDFKFIHRLAIAIKEINEYKMKLYYHEYDSYQEYIDLKINVETILISNVSEFVGNLTYVNMIKKWMFINLLLKEKKDVYERKEILITWLEELHTDAFLTYEEKMDHIIHNEFMKFENELNELSQQDSELKSYFNRLTNEKIYFNTSIVEEG